MAGQMGNKTITQQNLEVVMIDEENKLIIVKGSIPGHNGSYVKISDSIKKALPANAPFPTAIVEDKKQDKLVEKTEENNNTGGSSDES